MEGKIENPALCHITVLPTVQMPSGIDTCVLNEKQLIKSTQYYFLGCFSDALPRTNKKEQEMDGYEETTRPRFDNSRAIR